MDVQPGLFDDEMLARIAAHCRSLDPAAPTARERLEGALGPDLARKLLFALATGRRRECRAA